MMLDADILLFVTLHFSSTEDPLFAKISGAPSMITEGTEKINMYILFITFFSYFLSENITYNF